MAFGDLIGIRLLILNQHNQEITQLSQIFFLSCGQGPGTRLMRIRTSNIHGELYAAKYKGRERELVCEF